MRAMLRFCIVILFMPAAKSEKTYGLFGTEYEYLTNFFPGNDILYCHFRLSRLNKTEKQISARMEVFKKISNLQISYGVSRKTPLAGYIRELPEKMRSWCNSSKPLFPILKRDFNLPLNEEDCSLDKGVYLLASYSLDEEIKNWIGNVTIFGKFKLRMTWVEGIGKTKLCGVEIGYVATKIQDENEKENKAVIKRNHPSENGKNNTGERSA